MLFRFKNGKVLTLNVFLLQKQEECLLCMLFLLQKRETKVRLVFLKMIVFENENNPYLCASKNDSVAQLVEQLTLNQWVEGSSPSGVTL